MEIRLNIDGRWYEWVGGFGAIIVSREKGVKRGDVRVIGGELFYVASIWGEGYWRKPSAHWAMPKVSHEEIQRIKAKWFS